MSSNDDGEDGEKGNRHPKTSYNAQYPYNRVEVTESGHEVHLDDTPGNTRMRYAHKSGTYHEISEKGRFVKMVVDNYHKYIKGGYTKTVDKNSDRKVHGSHRENIGGHSHTEVKGDHTTAIGKDHKVTVGGDHATAVQGDQTHGVVGEMHFKIGKQAEIKIDDKLSTKTDGEATMEFGDVLNITAVTKIVLKCGGSTITMEPGKITIHSQEIKTESGGDTNIEAGGDVNIKAGGDVKTQGATTKIQGGGASAPPTTFT